MTINTKHLRDQLAILASDTCEDQTQFEAAQKIIAAAPELLDRADNAFALRVIAESVAAALERHGVIYGDDPGEAIDVLVADKDREIARLRRALDWYADMAKRMGNAAILQDKTAILTLMQTLAIDRGGSARAALAQERS